MPLNLTTTLQNRIGHNTSANPAYNKTLIPANFGGTTWTSQSGTTLAVDSNKYDDSFNPITPCHVSPLSVKTLIPNFHGKWHILVTPYNYGGGGGHIDVGLSLNTTQWVQASTLDQQARGFDVVISDWYGSGRYEDFVTLKLKAQVAAMTNFQYAIMIDLVYTTTAELVTHLNYIKATYFGTPGYLTQGGNPVLYFWGPGIGGVDYAAAFATAGITPYALFQGPSPLGNAWVNGVYDWVQPYLSGVNVSDPYNNAAKTSFLNSVHSSGKGSLPAISPGFNGYLTLTTAWSKGKYLQRDFVKCWLDQAALVNANLPTNCIGILVPTWNDWAEGTGIETAIDGGVAVAASIAANNLSWSVSGGSGNETSISSYEVLAFDPTAMSGVDTAILTTQLPGGTKTLDLTTIPNWGTTQYTIYVHAIGIPCVRSKVSQGINYTAPSTGGGGGGGGTTPPPPPVITQVVVSTAPTPSAKFQPAPVDTPLQAEDGTLHPSWIQWIIKIAPRLTSPVVAGTPSSVNSTGITGQVAQDGTFLYICTAANTWKKIPLASL